MRSPDGEGPGVELILLLFLDTAVTNLRWDIAGTRVEQQTKPSPIAKAAETILHSMKKRNKGRPNTREGGERRVSSGEPTKCAHMQRCRAAIPPGERHGKGKRYT